MDAHLALDLRRRAGASAGSGSYSRGGAHASLASHPATSAFPGGGRVAARIHGPPSGGNDHDARPLAGRASYDLSFVDMENEWESVREYSVAYGEIAWS